MRQIRAVSLKSYLDVAAFEGIDGLKLLSEIRISPADVDDFERRLPAEAAVRLLERSAEVSGCENFGILMAQCRSFASLGGISLLLQHLPTLGDIMKDLMSFRRSLSDVLFVGLDLTDELA